MIPTAAPGVTPPVDGPDPGSREGVADALDKLAKSSAISAPAKGLLAELREVLLTSKDSPRAADGWFDIDLVGTFARAETFPDDIDHPAQDRRFPYRPQLTLLEVLQGVFIFIPLLITWACLQQAADAYHRMLADPATSAAARTGNFLELWQTGFGGKLAGALKFEWAALYTLCAILTLVTITIVTAELRRREDDWRDKRDADRDAARRRQQAASRELLVTLARAQRIFNRERLATPTRFAAELSRAAGDLGALLAQAEVTQRRTLEVAERYDQTARGLTVAVSGLSQATSVMSAAVEDVRSAANVLDTSGRELRADVTAQVTGAAERLEAATAAAESQLERQRAAGQSTSERLAERLTATLSDVARRVGAATDGLVSAGDAYARAIRDSGQQAALHIGEAYQGEVLASTASMLEAVRAGTTAMQESAEAALAPLVTASGALTEAIRQAGDAGKQRTEALRASATQIATAATRSRSAFDEHSGVLREHSAALQTMVGQLTDALQAVGADVTDREKTMLDRNTDVLRQQATWLQEMTERLAAELATVDAAARSRQEDLLRGQADALREHATALQETAGRLTRALEQATAGSPRAADPLPEETEHAAAEARAGDASVSVGEAADEAEER